MRLCFNELLLSISYALDCVERDLIGVSTNHSKRVAYLCVRMGKKLGLNDKRLSDLTACAVLHDNALTEYIQAEYFSTSKDIKKIGRHELGIHCTLGERNVMNFPFFGDVKNAILYHHENVDGSGPFGKQLEEIPIYAAFIHMADVIDAKFHLREVNEEKFEKIKSFVTKKVGNLFSKRETEFFLDSFDLEALRSLSDERIDTILRESLPYFEEDYEPDQIMSISAIFARIIDYKSTFTSLHSMEIAYKAYQMGSFYNYSEEMCAKLFLAGALHDIGKLAVDTEILEKPDKLTDQEFQCIKNHAYITYKILRQVHGLEEITLWASLHHEKLNGAGYPFGYGAEKLGFHERLLACLDIYQALREDRPYKLGKTHQASMKILHKMIEDGLLDEKVVGDIDLVFQGKESDKSDASADVLSLE